MTSSFLTAGRASAAALVSLMALVTACSSASPAPRPSPTLVSPSISPTQAPSSAPASSPAPTSPAPTSSHPAAIGPQPCATRSLGAKTGISQGAAGSTYVQIVFTNISGTTCTLYGYPGVSFAGGSPVSQIGVAATEDPATPRHLITLAPGAAASALLRIVTAQNFPASRCHLVTAAYLQVYPPNQTTPIYISYSSSACAKPVHLLTVDVVKPGSGG
jgi:Protein of unknown function (DUF4232)